MSLIKILTLNIFPRMAHIINTRDEMISENASLKLRVKELEMIVNGNSNTDKATESSELLKDNSADFSVTIFDHRSIPGKK